MPVFKPIIKNVISGGGGTQYYLHRVIIESDGFHCYVEVINDYETEIDTIGDLKMGNTTTNYIGYIGTVLMHKMIGHPFESHTIEFKKCYINQALGCAETEDGTQIYSCSDLVIAL